ncbi:MAG: ABC transporter substrate-binding protein, partial [Alphaproteobacteria bacterium HGW-Alphaproteobacteria-8]
MSVLRFALAALLLLAATVARAQDLPTLRVAVLKFGTVNWLTDAIQTHGLDRAEGFRLETI